MKYYRSLMILFVELLFYPFLLTFVIRQKGSRIGLTMLERIEL